MKEPNYKCVFVKFFRDLDKNRYWKTLIPV